MLSRVHTGKGINMAAKEDEEAHKSLEEKLSNYRKPIKQPFIYRVPSYLLRDGNDNVHEPRMLAIGPYHHGKQSLKMMEERKLCCLKSLLLRRNESVERYVSAIAQIEEKARSCYAEELSFSPNEFVEMLVLDGCFIVELVRKSNTSSDLNFQMEWILEVLIQDLLFFDNQIPFFVLSKLFDLIKDEDEKEEFIASFFTFMEFKNRRLLEGLRAEEMRHLLHLTHALLCPHSDDVCIDHNASPIQLQFQPIPSATELKGANVTFSKSDDGKFDFDRGELKLPPLITGDEMQSFYKNMIFYEQYFPDNKPIYFTNYIMVLDSLVNTAEDVEILSQSKIINNMMGDNQVVADTINRLTYSVVLSQKNFIYADLFNRVNAHYKRPWNKAMAALKRDYFNTPWAYISFVAALLLLLLTLAQTVLSAI